MSENESRALLGRVVSQLTSKPYSYWEARAPRLVSRRRFLGVTFSESFDPVPESYTAWVEEGPFGTELEVSVDVEWASYKWKTIIVIVCVDDWRKESRMACEYIYFYPYRASGW